MEEKLKFNEDEAFEKKEPRKKFAFNKKIIITICILLIVIVLGVVEYTTKIFSGLYYSIIGEVGNTSGNITNCGYSVAKGDYIYFVAPSEDMQSTNICKVKNGSKDSEIIYNGTYDIRSLNIIGNKLYFIALSYKNENNQNQNSDIIDNKIYKMNFDGSNLQVINDNEFSDTNYQIYVIGNTIYYIGTDENVYKMDLNGKNRKLVVESGTGFLTLNSEYIIYNKSNDDNSDYKTCIKHLNKDDERVLKEERMLTPEILGDNIYYINSKKNIVKISVNGGEEEKIYDGSANNINIYNNDIYFLAYKDEKNEDYAICIYKISADGKNSEIKKEFKYYSSFINIVNDYMYYMDMDEEKAFINLVDINNTENELTLYTWSYGK